MYKHDQSILHVPWFISLSVLYIGTLQEQLGTFGNPLRAILTVIPLTAGDIAMDSVFYSGTEQDEPIGSQYQSLALIIWLSALIIMSVLFNNLLVTRSVYTCYSSGQSTIK